MNRCNHKLNTRGDSLIEVVLAIGVLALVIMTGWVIMTRLTKTAYYSRSRVELVNHLKGQVEILKTKSPRDLTDIGAWGTTVDKVNQQFCPLDASGFDRLLNEGIISNPFYIDSTYKPVPAIGKYKNDNNILYWIQYTDIDEKVESGATIATIKYRDYYARACWKTDNAKQPTDNIQIITRVPRT